MRKKRSYASNFASESAAREQVRSTGLSARSPATRSSTRLPKLKVGSSPLALPGTLSNPFSQLLPASKGSSC